MLPNLEKKSAKSQGNHLVHADVERFGGHFVDELEIKTDADALHVQVLA